MEQIRFFLPGPTYVREDIRQAMTRPSMGHRSSEFRTLFESLAPRLQQVFRTQREVLIATSSATMVMESAIISLVSDRVLNLTAGAFSERWNLIAESLGKSADRVSVPWGQAIDPDLVQRALERERYDAVTLVHNETSTGVIQPLDEITVVVRVVSDALLLLDGVSSLGGARIETDEWEVDLLLTGSQKALALPPGLAFFCLSERAVERTYEIQHRGYYTDLKRYLEKHRAGGTITTPGLPQIFALDRQLDAILQEGVENRWRRH
ncbi:MAG: aminotransferase class V-fold PLP-dependent enzyme, partial [Thermoanaerobaculia bacterium]